MNSNKDIRLDNFSSLPNYRLLEPTWSKDSTVAIDSTFHQIAPYIGRMKTSMARSLIEEWTDPGDLIVDPFCGSGVVPLEAAIKKRKAVAGDWNPYAVALTRAKLFPPKSLEEAELRLNEAWELSCTKYQKQDLRKVPFWVRKFFNNETLRKALSFRDACIYLKDFFLLACLLGILHHQRPGFLSYPSSHLVPYLRDKKFPKKDFPEMYKERNVLTRLQSKLARTFRRPPPPFKDLRAVHHVDARLFPQHFSVDAVITSPPYMNELDYIRDNRLRLWFIDRNLPVELEIPSKNRDRAYFDLLTNVSTRLAKQIKSGGYFIIVVGDSNRGSRKGYTISVTKEVFSNQPALNSFILTALYNDEIPDIRRSRRECRGTKNEAVLVYRKS
jgi:hypothetical protein